MSRVFVAARIFPKPGKADAVIEVLQGVIPLVRAEDGCLKYDLHVSMDEPAVLLYYEIWRDDDAFKAHTKAPHLAEMRGKIADLLEKPNEVKLWRAVNTTD